MILGTPLHKIRGFGPQFILKLKRLGIESVRDLLYHFPARYEDWSEIVKISELLKLGAADAKALASQGKTIQAEVKEIEVKRAWKRGMNFVEAIVEDESSEIKIVWFNQTYIVKTLKPGTLANFSGKLAVRKNEAYLSNPTYELVGAKEKVGNTKHTGRLVPIYPETKGLTSKGIRYLISPIIEHLDEVEDFLPADIREKYDLLEVNDAIKKIHFPENLEDADKARYRFAFEEIFILQLRNQKQKEALKKEAAPKIEIKKEKLNSLIKGLPFELTKSQKRTTDEIIGDLCRDYPMNRLLQGDVGSGKTVVAGIATLMVAETKQVAIMAPTEILARQHYKTFTQVFSEFGGGIALLTGKESKIFYGSGLESAITKVKLFKDIEADKVKIVIGTHALIQKNIKFSNLGLVIIDEQHRFGIAQRAELLRSQTNADSTQTNAENTENNDFLYKDITYKIRGATFNIKANLGLGHKEIIYQKALIEEFIKAELSFEQEKIIPIKYNNKKIGTYRPDFVIEDKILIELKALPNIGFKEEKQLWTYLKGSKYKVGLLINFGGTTIDIKRIVYDSARSLHESASSPRQSATPHFLSMSATPIPRTMMIAVFGDLDVSIIDELPKGRKEIITKVVANENRDKAYAFIRGQVRKGSQVYVICPRIDAPSTDPSTELRTGNESGANVRMDYKEMLTLDMKNVTEEYEKFSKKVFPDLRVSMLHGKMKAEEKAKIMSDFAEHKSDILVSTSVIEVGVDVPNATIMMIESAERFGLAQLYQFRGRVGRGDKQSFCFLFSESNTKTTEARLKSLVSAKNGFELAEHDLKLRGPGQFMGGVQTGLPDIAMQSLKNPNLIKEARESAMEIINKGPDLDEYPLLKEKLNELKERIHME